MSEQKSFKVFLKGVDKTADINSYKIKDQKVEVTFNEGKKFFYNLDNVEIQESILSEEKSKDTLLYLKEIADEVGIVVTINNKNINLLSNHFKRLDFVAKESLFAMYLSGKFLQLHKLKSSVGSEVVYPFGFNLSQKIAVEKALTHKMSIIEGPPGTGKTQTILNLISNIIMRGESVAVVSSNNSATQNIFEKLKKYQVDFLVANLGNKANKSNFLENQVPIPDLSDWLITDIECDKNFKILSDISKNIDAKLASKNKLSKLMVELSGLELEYQHFMLEIYSKENAGKIKINKSFKKSSDYLDLWLCSEDHEIFNAFKRIYYFLLSLFNRDISIQYSIDKLIRVYDVDDVVSEFQFQYYNLKLKEIKEEIFILEKELSLFNFKAKMEEYSELSLKFFKSNLAQKYKEGRSTEYTLSDLKTKSENFMRDYPVVLSTTYSLLTSLNRDTVYDYVIIDESSQVDICTGALVMSSARNIVIVGDLRQLPHVVDSETALKTNQIFKKYNLSSPYRYTQSFMSSLGKLFPEIPRTLLKEHYRCHPKIIEFCNRKFYNGELIILTSAEIEQEPLVIYKTVEGNHARNRSNQRQVDIIQNEIIPKYNLNLNDGSVGIISPYRNQTNLIRDTFSDSALKAETVDKFQGQENDVIILSTVDNQITDFADNAQRLNVAISRAIKKLILVVNEDDSLKDKNIGALIKYIESNNLAIISSQISSVFDLLYKGYSERRRNHLKNKKIVSRFDSENLMFNLILSVLEEMSHSSLDVSAHIPLKMIFKNTSNLDSSEFRFVSKTSSHVDFLIYDKLGKNTVLAIEVDGVAFHKDNQKQKERDQLKDGIFKKYGLPLIRFQTDGSNEREKLINLFEAIYK